MDSQVLKVPKDLKVKKVQLEHKDLKVVKVT